MGRLSLCLLTVIATCFLTACEDEKETNLFKSQLCLDNVDTSNSLSTVQSDVDGCVALLGSQDNERANVIRCSAAFVSEGIDEGAIVEAISNIDGEEAGDPTAPAISALAMSSTTASANAVTTCTKTNSEVLTALANFSNISTAMFTLLGATSGASASDIESLIAGYNPGTTSAADKEAMATAVIASQDSMCNSKDGLFKDDKVCEDIAAADAKANGDDEVMTDALMCYMDAKTEAEKTACKNA